MYSTRHAKRVTRTSRMQSQHQYFKTVNTRQNKRSVAGKRQVEEYKFVMTSKQSSEEEKCHARNEYSLNSAIRGNRNKESSNASNTTGPKYNVHTNSACIREDQSWFNNCSKDASRNLEEQNRKRTEKEICVAPQRQILYLSQAIQRRAQDIPLTYTHKMTIMAHGFIITHRSENSQYARILEELKNRNKNQV